MPRRRNGVKVPDIRLVQNPNVEAVTIDWLLQSSGMLDETQALASAVILALGTDRLALPDDLLPDPDSDDRRGWWGDLEAEDIWNGWPIGTRLWLMRRDKITGTGSARGSTIARAENYVKQALQPFIDRRIASRVEVVAERHGLHRIDVLARLYRGPKSAVELRFAGVWSEQLGIA